MTLSDQAAATLAGDLQKQSDQLLLLSKSLKVIANGQRTLLMRHGRLIQAAKSVVYQFRGSKALGEMEEPLRRLNELDHLCSSNEAEEALREMVDTVLDTLVDVTVSEHGLDNEFTLEVKRVAEHYRGQLRLVK